MALAASCNGSMSSSRPSEARAASSSCAPPALVEAGLQNEEGAVGICHNRSQIKAVGPCGQRVGAPAAQGGEQQSGQQHGAGGYERAGSGLLPLAAAGPQHVPG